MLIFRTQDAGTWQGQTLIFLFLASLCQFVYALPKGFVYLDEVAPDIIEDIRYAGHNNFVGSPIPGYLMPRCILTRRAAEKLQRAQADISSRGYRLKVYDCYRPQMSVDAFNRWSQDDKDTRMKALFYPNEAKNKLFSKGYIARYSGHSRGSTVDITLVKIPQRNKRGATNQHHRSINMGTRFDYFDKSTHVFYPGLNQEQLNNRMLLRRLMIKFDFVPYHKEWWHFTLRDEPYPRSYFNFPVQ